MDASNQNISTFASMMPKSLELNKRIFLSHSGQDKPFVKKLYKALKQSKYDVFFDEEILPKAERITMKEILEEVEISEMCVFVLSDAFFTITKNPMLELISFLTAQEKDPMKRILPLFYKLTVSQFKEEQRQCMWVKKWEEWEEEYKKKGITLSDFNLEKWKGALKIISQTNGVEIKECNEEQYIEVIVSHICRIVPPDVQYDVSYAQGKERMCKEVDDLFAECKKDPTRACILGMHGLGGLGKTTLSKVLFNYYWPQFEGRVIRIELDSASKEGTFQRLCMVLKTIHSIPEEILASLHDVDEAWHLYLGAIGRKKVFFIIDNANLECKDEIGKYMKGILHRESKMLILSRSQTLLEDFHLGYPNFHIAKILSLRKEEAETMFLQRLNFFGREHELSKRERDIMRDGIELCFFEGAYHPMAVLVLGSWMRQKDWEAIVTFLSKHRARKLGKTVIDLLKKSFDDMEENPQKILLDLALYRPSPHLTCKPYEWLSIVNEINEVEVNNVLAELRDRAFLCGNNLEIHELVKELAILATSTNTCLGCIYFDKNSEVWDRLGDISNARNVKRFAMESFEAQISKLSLKGFPRLRVVKIKDINGLKEIEMEENMMFLQSLEVSSLEFMKSLRNDDQIKSKNKPYSAIIVKHLACCVNLKWMSLENCIDSIVMQPQPVCRSVSLAGSGSMFTSLRILRLVANQRFPFPLETLDKGCNSLEELILDGYDVGKLCRLPKFSHLHSMSLNRCLWTHEFDFGLLSKLEKFNIDYAPKLRRICGFKGCTTSVGELTLNNISSLEYLGLGSIRELRTLSIFGCGKLNGLDGLKKMDSLQGISLGECDGLVRLEGLEKFNSLIYIDVQGCRGLVGLEGLEKINSLESLVLFNCNGMVSLFEGVEGEDEEITSSLINLREVHIQGCPNLTHKFGIVNVKSFERDNSEFVESVLFMWNVFLRAVKEINVISPTTLIHNDNIARCNRELVVGPISQPQTISVTPCHIPFHNIIIHFCHEHDIVDAYLEKAMEGFLKMLMVALCWSSQEQRMAITKQLLESKYIVKRLFVVCMPHTKPNTVIYTMTQYLSMVHPVTLLTCLVYLWCHDQIPSFNVILQMAGGMGTLFKSWDHGGRYNGVTIPNKKSRIQHGILLLTLVGITRPEHLPNLATNIATIYLTTLFNMNMVLDKEGNKYDLKDAQLPHVAKDAMLKLLNEDNVQRVIRNLQRELQKKPREFQKQIQFQDVEISIEGIDNLELFNRLFHDIPCWYDLERFLCYTTYEIFKGGS